MDQFRSWTVGLPSVATMEDLKEIATKYGHGFKLMAKKEQDKINRVLQLEKEMNEGTATVELKQQEKEESVKNAQISQIFLFKLPVVALRRVLSLLSEAELYALHYCSPHIAEATKYSKPRRSFRIRIDLVNHLVEIADVFSIDFHTMLHEKALEAPKILQTASNPSEATFVTAQSVMRQLGAKNIENLRLSADLHAEQVFDWVRDEGFTVMNLELHSGAENVNDDNLAQRLYQRILEKPLTSFTSSLITSLNFSFPTSNASNKIEIEGVQVQYSQWFTLTHLLAINYQFLHLKNSKLESGDINMFLKLWIDGGHQNKRVLSISLKTGKLFDLEIVLFNIVNAPEFQTENDIVIRSKSGKRATININEELDVFTFELSSPT